MSLVVVASALPFRSQIVPFVQVGANWLVAADLLCGSLAGTWLRAGWATRLRSETLYKVIAVMLVGIAGVLLHGHGSEGAPPILTGAVQVAAGVAASFLIGVVAAVLGVAGGELLIPTIVLLYGGDIKHAGSLSLAVSHPTMHIAFARYSRDGSFVVIRRERSFALVMAVGSVAGAFIGGYLLGLVPGAILLPLLAGILLLSARKVWRYQ